MSSNVRSFSVPLLGVAALLVASVWAIPVDAASPNIGVEAQVDFGSVRLRFK